MASVICIIISLLLTYSLHFSNLLMAAEHLQGITLWSYPTVPAILSFVLQFDASAWKQAEIFLWSRQQPSLRKKDFPWRHSLIAFANFRNSSCGCPLLEWQYFKKKVKPGFLQLTDKQSLHNLADWLLRHVKWIDYFAHKSVLDMSVSLHCSVFFCLFATFFIKMKFTSNLKVLSFKNCSSCVFASPFCFFLLGKSSRVFLFNHHHLPRWPFGCQHSGPILKPSACRKSYCFSN